MIKLFSSKFRIAAFSILVVAALVSAVVTPAFAKAEDPIRDLSNLTRLQNSALSATLRHEQLQARIIARQLNGEGHKAMTPKLAQAKMFLNTAQALLESHEGFDADGNVLTRSAAIGTLARAEYNLRNANYWIVRHNKTK